MSAALLKTLRDGVEAEGTFNLFARQHPGYESAPQFFLARVWKTAAEVGVHQ
jgi:hypothetical protein